MSTNREAEERDPRKVKTGITHQEPDTEMTTDYDKIEEKATKTPARNYQEELESTVTTADTSVEKLVENINQLTDDETDERTDDSSSKKKS